MSSEKLPRQVDFEKMAQNRAHLAGSLELSDFQRLLPNLANDQGQVTIDLSFSKDLEGFAQCVGEFSLQCNLQCQRCLQPYLHKLHAQIGLTAVKDDEQALGLISGMEPIVIGDEELTLVEIIEDEILLLMPLIPKHADSQCPMEVAEVESSKGRLASALADWQEKLKK